MFLGDGGRGYLQFLWEYTSFWRSRFETTSFWFDPHFKDRWIHDFGYFSGVAMWCFGGLSSHFSSGNWGIHWPKTPRPGGGDSQRRAFHIHHGVTVTDAFMEAVEKGNSLYLVDPYTGTLISKVSARELWARVLTTRIETGKPYIIFIDTVNQDLPDHQRSANLNVTMSNLGTEIFLLTGVDQQGKAYGGLLSVFFESFEILWVERSSYFYWGCI